MNRGAIIKNLRESRNLTQGELAARLGVSQRTISSWETWRTQPKFDDYCKMADIFDCSLDELSGRVERRLGNITVEDILVKLHDLDVWELRQVRGRSEQYLDTVIQINNLEAEKDKLEQRVKEYATKIQELKNGDN